MKIIERKLFMGSNTADGFVGFYDKIADWYGLRKLYILKGGSGVGKSTFIKKFAKKLIERATSESAECCPLKLTIEYLVCSGDPNSIDGAIVHELGIGIIDGTSPHMTDPKYPGLVEEIIDLAQFIDKTKIKATQEDLRVLLAKKQGHYQNAFAELEKARQTHNKIEAIMTPSVDFQKVDGLLQNILP